MQLSTLNLSMTRPGIVPFSVASLFFNNEQGVWYDPSDLTTLFQDAAGTTPVTAVEQPVGLMLDKSKGLVTGWGTTGSELITNPGPFSNTNNWSSQSGVELSIQSSKLKLTCTSQYGRAITAIPTTIGKKYIVFVNAVAISGGWGIAKSDSDQQNVNPEYGSLKGLFFTATATTSYIWIICNNTGTNVCELTSITAKETAGNHAYQTTSANRPTLSARVNTFVKTEDFTGSNWSANNCTKTSATKITATATYNVRITQGYLTNTTNTWTYRAKVLKGKNFVIAISGSTSGTGAIFNGTTGSYVNTTTIGSKWSLSTYSCVTDSSDSNYWIASITVANTSNDTGVNGALCINNSFGTTWGTGWDAVVGDTLTATNHDLRVANDGVGIPAYQRVDTATDYDTVGFPKYLSFNGSSSSMVTNTITPNTDKAQVFAGVRKLSDAAAGVLIESSAGISTNNGVILIYAPPDVAGTGYRYLFASKGTVTSIATTSSTTYNAPVTNVVSSLSSISGDSVILRANGSQIGADTTTDQGTGNYLAYPLYIGARGGSSLWLNGRIYSMIVRFGSNLATNQIANTEKYINTKTKAY